MASYRVFSSDNHVFEQPDLWTSRIEPRFKDRAPHVVREKDGDWWYIGGRKFVGLEEGAETGRRFEAPEKLTLTDFQENVRPGAYIPEAHVKDMEADGVEGMVLYPTIGFTLYGAVKEGEFLTLLFRIYNDWLAEFCKPFPNRLKGIALLNVDDVQAAVKELGRCAKMGLGGGMIPVYPTEDRLYNSPQYEPLWAAAQDLEMPLGLHIATNRLPLYKDFTDFIDLSAAFLANADYWARMSLAHIIYSGVFERYPKLRVGSVEHEVSWVANFLWQLDYNYTQRTRRNESWPRFKEDMLPSDYFHRNCFVSFQEEDLGIRLRDVIGVDNMLWGSDYPHVESTFPRTQQILGKILADCTEEEKAKIAGGNTARIYHFD